MVEDRGWGRGVGGRAVRVWAVALAAVYAVAGAMRMDRAALAVAGLTAVAAALTLLRRGLLGRLGLAAIATATITFLVPAAVANLRDGEQFADVAVPAVLAALAVAVLALVLGAPPAPVLGLAGLLLVAAVAAGAVAGGADAVAADARVRMEDVDFVPDRLRISSGSTVAATNGDLFWHTFAVPDLDLEVRVPTGATRTVEITARPGSYEFVCTVPGHEGAGMEGTLTVE